MRTGMSPIQSYRYLQMLPTKGKIRTFRELIKIFGLFSTEYQAIMTHLRAKLDVPAYEWRRILKVFIHLFFNTCLSNLVLDSGGVYLKERSPPRSLRRALRHDVQTAGPDEFQLP